MNPNGESNFSVTGWPGRRSASFGHEVRPGQWGLVLRLDPVDLLITQAPFPTGAADFVRWCRELSRAAGHVASQVENTTSPGAPRHYLDEPTAQDNQQDGGERGW